MTLSTRIRVGAIMRLLSLAHQAELISGFIYRLVVRIAESDPGAKAARAERLLVGKPDPGLN